MWPRRSLKRSSLISTRVTLQTRNLANKLYREFKKKKDMLVSNIAFKVVHIAYVQMLFNGSTCIRPIDSSFYVSDINDQKNRFAYGFAEGEVPSFNWFIGFPSHQFIIQKNSHFTFFFCSLLDASRLLLQEDWAESQLSHGWLKPHSRLEDFGS